jgi:AraC family transcriptional regulator of adaptative response/methylated-DNA-[protein]-cysteine methyltransferase
MDSQQQHNYKRVAAAIEYIVTHFREQPSLDEVAQYVNLSPFHFHRLFSNWAGITPKKFLQYISIEHARKLLKEQQASLSHTAFDTGLSGTGRLHDLFVQIEGMTPAEYRNGGESLTIHYSFAPSPFGEIIVASTSKGVCYLAFTDTEVNPIDDLQRRFPRATLYQAFDMNQKNALHIFQHEKTDLSTIKLHLKGTPFQVKVWEALLKIPKGNLTTYGQIASQVGNESACRAVGTAIGSNPVSFLIPCHRVIQSSGKFGGYMWGTTRKIAMIGWESAQIENEEEKQGLK